MTLEILFDETDKQRIEKAHDHVVARELEQAINRKNETLQWKDNIEQCRRRFYNMIEKNGYRFPEMYFTANHTDYRAVLVWVEDPGVFIVYRVVKKEDHYQTSEQHKVLDQLYKHPRDIVFTAKERAEQIQASTSSDSANPA